LIWRKWTVFSLIYEKIKAIHFVIGNMTIRTKTWLFVLIVVVILTASLISVVRLIVLTGFDKVEHNLTLANVRRSGGLLNRSLEELSSAAGDYSSWDSTYEFVKNANRAYQEENFISTSFANINVNCMLFYDTAMELRSQACFFNPEEKTPQFAPATLLKAIRSIDGFLNLSESSSGRTGFIDVDGQLVMAVARPILHNDQSGPSRGTLVFCSFVDSRSIKRLSHWAGFPLALKKLNGNDLDHSVQEQFLAGADYALHVADDTTIDGYALIKELSGRTTYVLSSSHVRSIHSQGLKTIVVGIVWLICIVVLISAVALFGIEAVVLARLRWLRNSIDVIKRSRDSRQLVPVTGRDEVSSLAIDINLMLQAIQAAQKRADESEERYKTLFDEMLNAFVLYELVYDDSSQPCDCLFVEINPAFERVTGLMRNEVIGRTLKEVMPEIEPHWLERYARVVADGQPVHFEDYCGPLDRYLEVMAFKAGGGNRFGLTFTDITERIRTEQERAEAREHLAQLRQMEAVGHLAGGVAHDFNNQLTAILGFADLIREELHYDPEISQFAQNIIDGSRRTADLTAQLLAFAQKGKYFSNPIDIQVMIREVIHLLEREMDKRITVCLQFEADSAIVIGDPAQIRNVIMNIAMNARDAMPEGGEMRLTTQTVSLDEIFSRHHHLQLPSGSYLCIRVSDTGCGMDQETMKRIFDPFFTQKPFGMGKGMGLASAFGTIKNHGGAILVASEPAQGSTFSVYLPAVP